MLHLTAPQVGQEFIVLIQVHGHQCTKVNRCVVNPANTRYACIRHFKLISGMQIFYPEAAMLFSHFLSCAYFLNHYLRLTFVSTIQLFLQKTGGHI